MNTRINPSLVWCAALILLITANLLQAVNKEPVFIFEGTINSVDKALGPLSQTGDVISGTLTLKALSPKDALPDDETKGKYEDYLLGAEVTLDRHYILRGAFKLDSSRPVTAFTAMGQTDAGQPQSIAYTIPIAGSVTGVGDFEALWMEVWLYDTRDRMLLSDSLPQKRFAWEAGTFRLTFLSPGTGGYAYLSGAISRFSDDEPEAKDNAEAVAQLEQMVVELNGVINRQQADITDLNARMEEAKQHAAYLEVQLKTAKEAVENSPYKVEADKLKAEAVSSKAVTEEAKNRVIELEVKRAEEATRNKDLKERNDALQAALVAVQQESEKFQADREKVAYELAMVKQMRIEAERNKQAAEQALAAADPDQAKTAESVNGKTTSSQEIVVPDPVIPAYNPPTLEEVDARARKLSERAKRFIRPASSDFQGGPRRR